MEIVLRGLLDDDRAPIARLLEETGVFRPEEVAVALELLDVAFEKPDQVDYTFLVAEAGGALAGYACWGPTPCTRGTFDLYWMAAATAFHGQGVAKRLLEAAEEDMALRRAKLCVIETSSLPPYEAARRFYLKSGYQEVARIPDFYGPGDARVIFTKALG